MSDASDDLARRIRATLGLRPDLSETRRPQDRAG